MSNRHLRRLNKDEFLLDSGSGSGSEDDTRNVSSQSKFAFLASSDPEESENETDVESTANDSDNDSEESLEIEAKQKGLIKESSSDEEEVDLDELIEKLESAKTEDKIINVEESSSVIFNVDLDHLDPALELRKKLGGNVTSGETSNMDSHLPDQLPRHVANRLKAHIKQHSRSQKRYRKQLIVPRPSWTRVTSSHVELSLERLDDDLLYGQSAFHLVPSSKYDELFDEFVMLVDAGDIENLYSFAHQNPLHVDTLLVVSDYLRMSSSADASELTERALYILEKCCLSTKESNIDLTAGTLRLPYHVFDNRRMHLTIIRYVQFLTKKGCCRTALEFSKILWSLDPLIDPLSVRLIADFLAIQSNQFEWFEQVYNEIVRESPWMANWHYSNALQLFIRNRINEADTCLQQSIMDHPWIIPKLAAFCGLQVDEQAWNVAFQIIPSNEKHVECVRNVIAKVYSQRCGPLWKSPKTCAWLEKSIGIALSKATPMTEYKPTALECLPLFRHSLVSDLNNVTVSLPSYVAIGPTRLYDPLPPEYLNEDASNSSQKCILQ